LAVEVVEEGKRGTSIVLEEEVGSCGIQAFQ
jgi:hypothetical protein